MSSLSDFAEITQADVLLAPMTWLKVGGPAQNVVRPRTVDELRAVVRCCFENDIAIRVIGEGSNILVPDDGVPGVVLRLEGDAFDYVRVDGATVRAGAATLLSHVISRSVEAGLAGLEVLVGIPGPIGGAVKGNAGGRSGEIGDVTTAVSVVTGKGEQHTRRGEDLTFEYRRSSVNELVVTEVELTLQTGDAEAISQRMRKLWIMKKASQPLAFQSAGCIFKNPRGLSAGALIEQAGLKGTRVGHCEVSDRHANFIVTSEARPPTKCSD
ncbi:MAG: UDP-N-acetylmuramate dehydrogenase [Planctomycetaceae bacterium]